METTMKNCTGMESKLADLLLDPESAPLTVVSHVEQCDRCRVELAELRATMNLMDEWAAPEPSPYFLSKLDVRMREEREAEPVGWPASWIARLRARFVYGPSLHTRPLAAMALAVMLLVGGGAYIGLTDLGQPQQPPTNAAVVHDLQLLDSNSQLLDKLESLSNSGENGD
jgi:anti-sigma factor RsiW